MSEWEDIEARLSVGFMGHVAGGSCDAEKPCLGCDIRAALERVDELERDKTQIEAEVLYEQERNRNNVAQYTAEVARLEGLILGADEEDGSGPVPCTIALEVEAKRIRAQREEGSAK